MNIREDAIDKHVACCSILKDNAYHSLFVSYHINARCAYCKKYMNRSRYKSGASEEDMRLIQRKSCQNCPILWMTGTPCCLLPEMEEMLQIEDRFSPESEDSIGDQMKPLYKSWLQKIGFYGDVVKRVPEIAKW